MEFQLDEDIRPDWGAPELNQDAMTYRKFKRLDDIFIFYDSDLIDNGAIYPGKVVLIRDGQVLEVINADDLGADRIGSHVWLSYEDTDNAEDPSQKGSVLVGIASEWTK